MRIPIILLAALTGAMPATATSAKTRTTSPKLIANDLVATDRGFAAAAASKLPADAIAAMLDDDIVMFILPQPHLARGRAEAVELLGKAFAGEASTLAWTPIRAGISADGRQGFTYGFTTRTSARQPPRLGKYLSYWVKRGAGWRLAAFKLVPRAEGAVSSETKPPILPAHLVIPANRPNLLSRYKAELDATERAFSDESQVIGIGPAFGKYGTADAMNISPGGADFTYGNETIAADIGPDKSSPLRWAPDGVLVASSGDLGITYGYLKRNGEVPAGRLAQIPWFTVWRRASPRMSWRYVAE